MIKTIFSILFLTCSYFGLAQSFTETSFASGINFSPNPTGYMGGGVAVFDYDNDGFEDIYVTGCLESDHLFHNNGDGTFEDVTGTAGLEETSTRNTLGVTTGDIDNDGDRDIFVCTWRNILEAGFARNILFLNNGDGTFTDISEDVGITEESFSTSATFLDLNLDGWLDIYVGNYVEEANFIYEDDVIVGFDHTCFGNYFYLNNGNGTFTELSEEWGIDDSGCALAIVASDYDLDYDPDFMIANDFGQFIIPNVLFENESPSESCENVSEESGANIGLYGMGIAAGDYDEDQDIDYYISNLGTNALLQNDGDGHFEDATSFAQVGNTGANDLLYTSWGTFFFDYDNDSWLDLFVCNGHMPSVALVGNNVLDPNKLYANNQDGTFTDVSSEEGIADENIGRGSAWGDFNNDGFPEIVTVDIFNELIPGSEHVMYYENSANENHWLGLSLEGVESNADALGTIVKLYVDDRTIIREVTGGGAHASQSSTRVLFGLGEYEQVDSVAVFWPGDNHEVFMPEIDQYHHLVEGQVTHIEESILNHNNIKVFPNPCQTHFQIEITALDFRVENIVLLDATGRELFEAEIIERIDKKTIEVSLIQDLNGGLYFVKLISQFDSITIPIIVE